MALDLHLTASNRLRAVDQRYTRQRRELVDLLCEARHPRSIPEILAVQPKLAQSSVYRNLAVLTQAGVVRRVVAADDFARYELAEDLTEHHHHLICSTCGGIEDFTASPQVERTVARTITDIADRTGFVSQHHRLDLIGTCAACD
jgi:Fe2+ or Zn2+ uptake regulation protein